MFGGIGFLIRGNMACGVHGRDLIVRVGPAAHDAALREAGVRPFDLSAESPAKGCVRVRLAGLNTTADLKTWVDHAVEFARSLPGRDETGDWRLAVEQTDL